MTYVLRYRVCVSLYQPFHRWSLSSSKYASGACLVTKRCSLAAGGRATGIATPVDHTALVSIHDVVGTTLSAENLELSHPRTCYFINNSITNPTLRLMLGGTGNEPHQNRGDKGGMFVLLHVRIGKLEPASIQLMEGTGNLVIKTSRSVTRTNPTGPKQAEPEKGRKEFFRLCFRLFFQSPPPPPFSLRA